MFPDSKRKVTGFIFTTHDILGILEKHGYLRPALPEDARVVSAWMGHGLDPEIHVMVESEQVNISEEKLGPERTYRFHNYPGHSCLFSLDRDFGDQR